MSEELLLQLGIIENRNDLIHRVIIVAIEQCGTLKNLGRPAFGRSKRDAPRLDHLGHPDTETLSLCPMDSVAGRRQNFYFALLRDRAFQNNPWHPLHERLN